MSSGNPLVSVVVPVLNDAAALTRLLSDLGQRDEFEVLVVDGGSQDASRNVAASANRLIESVSGRARQLRLGTAQARGALVWMLHADSRVDDALCSEILSRARDPQVRWGRVDVRLGAPGRLFRVIEFSMNWRSRVTGICTGDQGLFIRRSLLEAVGGVPPQALMEDIELCKRLRRLGPPTCLSGPIETSARRWLQNGVLQTVLGMWMLRIRYFFGADPERLARQYYG